MAAPQATATPARSDPRGPDFDAIPSPMAVLDHELTILSANRAFAGWDLIRYPGPRLAAAPADQNIREPIKPLRTSAHGARHGD